MDQFRDLPPANWWDTALGEALKKQQYEQKAALEKDRRQLWISVAAAVAGSIGCSEKSVPATWADAVLADFDKRF